MTRSNIKLPTSISLPATPHTSFTCFPSLLGYRSSMPWTQASVSMYASMGKEGRCGGKYWMLLKQEQTCPSWALVQLAFIKVWLQNACGGWTTLPDMEVIWVVVVPCFLIFPFRSLKQWVCAEWRTTSKAQSVSGHWFFFLTAVRKPCWNCHFLT